jgi:uncharacterized oligopeptide transporter (OPT) family protein
VLGLNKALSSILAGIGVVVFGFAFQDIAAILSGIILAFREPLKEDRNKGCYGHSN